MKALPFLAILVLFVYAPIPGGAHIQAEPRGGASADEFDRGQPKADASADEKQPSDNVRRRKIKA